MAKNSDSIVSVSKSCLQIITDSSDNVLYSIGVRTIHYARERYGDIDYYIDDIKHLKTYYFDASVFRSIDTLLFTPSSPIFCFTPQFLELIATGSCSIPFSIPAPVASRAASYVSSFLKRHSALARIGSLFIVR